MSDQPLRRSLRIGYEIRERLAVALDMMPLTLDERHAKAERQSPRNFNVTWSQLYFDVLAKKDGFLDEFPRSESFYQHVNQGRPLAWVLVDIADGIGVGLDDLVPTRAIDSPHYRAARLALAPRGLRRRQCAKLWRLIRTVCETFRAVALTDEKLGDKEATLTEAYVSAVETATRRAREQALNAHITTSPTGGNARSAT